MSLIYYSVRAKPIFWSRSNAETETRKYFWAVTITKGRRFSEKDWYYLQAQTDMPFHYLKLVV